MLSKQTNLREPPPTDRDIYFMQQGKKQMIVTVLALQKYNSLNVQVT